MPVSTKFWAAFDEQSWSDINATFGKRPGTYRLRLKSHDGAGWHVVPRLLRPDPEGILYIGMSRSIIDRVSALRGGLYGAYGFTGGHGKTFANPGAHQCSERMPPEFVETFHQDRLVIEVNGFRSEAEIPVDFDAAAAERTAISGYGARFGESPPFNSTWSRLEAGIHPDE